MTATSSVAKPDRLASGRVLVVEDDPALRNVVRFNLEQAGFEVVAASDAHDGWRKLNQSPADLILTDFNLPRTTGVEFCRQVRGDGRFASLPIMMLTAKGFEIDAEQLRTELGILEVVFKPFSPRQLVRTVASYLRDARIETG